MDIVITTDRLPKVGETVIGRQIDYFVGGKGANQAVAAARSGAQVSFLAKIGEDTFGEKVAEHLKREQLDLSQLEVEKNIFTGLASIFNLPEDNCITVVSGANELVDEDYVGRAQDSIKQADVLLLQLEIPVAAIRKGLNIARENKVTTILNPAPYNQSVQELLPQVDYLTPNETEFAALLGVDKLGEDAIEQQMLLWQEQHATRLILTRGSHGVSFVEEGRVVTVPAYQVVVEDTTGAGDTFNGVLASELSRGSKLGEAIAIANAGSGLAVTKLGAQTGMPTGEEIQAFLQKHS